jgi:tripartite-type tricarboxylate transporter receptor subunit TctC
MTKYVLAVFCALIALSASPARGWAEESGEDFYKGKQITIIVSSGAGAYDAYARTFARYMPKYIPGHPNMIVQAMEGAGGVVAANYLYNVAARDGTVIGGVHGNVLTAQLLSPQFVKYDTAKFSWIGNATRDTYVGYVMANAPIKTLAEAKTTQVLMGGTSVGGAGIDMAILGRDLFGFNFKIISGYKTSSETELALQRGEIDGTFAHAWTSLKTQKPDWLADGKIRIIVQHGFTRHPELPDVPLMLDFAQDELQRQILGVELVRQDISKPYMAPRGVPADRLKILRDAFDASLKDPDLIADLKHQSLEIDQPMNGEELSALVTKIAATPEPALKKLQDLLANFRAGG